MAATGADVSVVFVPPAGTRDAVIEAIRSFDEPEIDYTPPDRQTAAE